MRFTRGLASGWLGPVLALAVGLMTAVFLASLWWPRCRPYRHRSAGSRYGRTSRESSAAATNTASIPAVRTELPARGPKLFVKLFPPRVQRQAPAPQRLSQPFGDGSGSGHQ